MSDSNVSKLDGKFQDVFAQLYDETTVQSDGSGTLSIRGVERFLGLRRGTFQKHLDRRHKTPTKLIKRLQGKGLDVTTWKSEGVPDAALGIIANYFSATQGGEVEDRADFLATLGARVLLQRVKGWHPPTQNEPNQFEGIGYALDAILAPLKLAPELQAGIRAEAIAAQVPELRPAIEETKKHLLLPTKDRLLTPTELGQLFDEPKTPNAVNKMLLAEGLQTKTGDRKCPYLPAGRGHDHSELVADTAKGHGKTVQSLKWFESVMDLLT